jgi:hypothetical protein
MKSLKNLDMIKKGCCVLTIALFFILTFSESKAQNINKDEQEKDQFKKEAQEIYRSVDIASIVPYEAFFKGYVGYHKYRRKLNGSPLISFLNYSIPSNQPRFVTVDFKARTTPFITHAAEGRNSASDGGSPCSMVETIRVDGRSIPACEPFMGVPAVSFSDQHNSLKSTLGFILVAGPNFGKVVGKSLILRGLEEGNQGIESREILFHSGNYVEIGGNSWGCIAVPPSQFNKGFELLKNNTLIYSFEGSKFSGGGPFLSMASPLEATLPKPVVIPESLPSVAPIEVTEPNAITTSVSEEELKSAVNSSKDQNYSPAPNVSNVKRETAAFEEQEIAKAPPSKMASSMGLSAVGGATYTPKNNRPESPDILKGSSKYEECQKLSDAPWEDVVADIKAGENPSKHFAGSWNELQQTLKLESVENAPAIDRAEERVAIINDCVASAHISQRTDFSKKNINQPEKKSSEDGRINCVYEGPESQDYQACLETISAHDALLKEEADAHAKQAKDFKASSEKRVGNVAGENAQSQALEQFSGLQTDHANIATERANFSEKKLNLLMAIASQIPTTDSLYDECKAKFMKHGTVSINEYNEFAKIYSATPKNFKAERDYCLSAVTSGVKPLHNQPAREEVKKVLKKFGKEMEDYQSKSEALLNRSTLTPSLNDSSSGYSMTNLKSGESEFNSRGEGLLGSGRGRTQLNNVESKSESSGGGPFFNRSNQVTGSSNGRVNQASGPFSSSSSASSFSSSAQGPFLGNTSNGINRESSGTKRNGIYNEEFYQRIDFALKNPERLAELKLSTEEMSEYLEKKRYNELMNKTNNDIGGRSPATDSKLVTQEIKNESVPVGISEKGQNLFEIISLRYAKKFFGGL